MPPVATHPSVWFLDDRQNPGRDAAGNVDPKDPEKSQLSVWTSGNKVTPLIDGAPYMERLYRLIEATREKDYILLAGWQMNANQRLLLGDDASELLKTLARAQSRKVDVRVMLSNHVTSGTPSQPNREMYNGLTSKKIPVILDARHANLGSAHQKIALVLQNDGLLHAFCGGIDLAHDRWDTPDHQGSPKRQFADHPGGWHDVQCHLVGPAARDVDLTFRERWNDTRNPRFAEDVPVPITTVVPRKALPLDGKHHVQILRTYSCIAPYPFAKRGEFTARRAYLKAIELAQNYIYVEDQFFTSFEIANALEAALKRSSALRVIVLLPQVPDPPFISSHNYHQASALRQLRAAAPDRFAAYHLQTKIGGSFREVYVHAKVMIVDDVWACIGSMNCNRRSFTHDCEIGAAVVDAEITGGVCKFALELRLSLWSEHLQVPGPGLVDPTVGFAKWRELASTDGNRVRTHEAAVPRESNLWSQVDPSGVCRDAK